VCLAQQRELLTLLMLGVGEDIRAELDQEGVEAFGVRAHTVHSGQQFLRAVLLVQPGLDHRLAAVLLPHPWMHA
jgi:hypothetical protein